VSITFEQALSSQEFHQTGGPDGRPCESINGPVRWRRNGKTQTWKTRPTEFKIPVKFGFYSYDYITQGDATGDYMHAAEDCPRDKILAELNCPSVHEPRPALGNVSRCICGHGKRSACHGWS
jgi:hypothetical protein